MELVKNNEALQVHTLIIANMQTAASSFVEVCRNLKIMRDKKLYIDLGLESFEDYAVQMVGIKQRQAYSYIKIYEENSPKLLAEHGDLGVTKLAILTKVTAIDREKFIAENDVENISVKELERLVNEKKGLNEQISLLVEEKGKVVRECENAKRELLQCAELEDENEQLKKKIAQLEKQTEKLQEVDVNVQPADIEKIKQEAIDDAEKTLAKKIKSAKAEIKKKAEAEKQREIEKAKELFIKENEKIKAEMLAEKQREIEELKNAAQRAADEHLKELEVAKSTESTEFVVHFNILQTEILAMREILQNLRGKSENEMADKLEKALTAAINKILNGE